MAGHPYADHQGSPALTSSWTDPYRQARHWTAPGDHAHCHIRCAFL